MARGTTAIAGGVSPPTLTVKGNYNRTGASAKSADGIATALRRLPTLVSSDATKGGPNASYGAGSLKLPSALHRLPTHCATDYKSPYSEAGYTQQTQKRSKPLRDTLKHTTGHRLTPAFAEWWMGFPLGFTASVRWAMRKSRSSRRRRG